MRDSGKEGTRYPSSRWLIVLVIIDHSAVKVTNVCYLASAKGQ